MTAYDWWIPVVVVKRWENWFTPFFRGCKVAVPEGPRRILQWPELRARAGGWTRTEESDKTESTKSSPNFQSQDDRIHNGKKRVGEAGSTMEEYIKRKFHEGKLKFCRHLCSSTLSEIICTSFFIEVIRFLLPSVNFIFCYLSLGLQPNVDCIRILSVL